MTVVVWWWWCCWGSYDGSGGFSIGGGDGGFWVVVAFYDVSGSCSGGGSVGSYDFRGGCSGDVGIVGVVVVYFFNLLAHSTFAFLLSVAFRPVLLSCGVLF